MRENKLSILHIIYVALFSAFIAICSWISIPSPIPFTLQTMAIITTLGLLGGKLGTLSVGIYLLLGAVGLPVFSSFSGGIGFLFGATGGYTLGFLLLSLIIWFGTRKNPSIKNLFIFSVIGLLALYLVGTLWYCFIYMNGMAFLSAFMVCVLPFIIPDLIKLIISLILVKKLKRFIVGVNF